MLLFRRTGRFFFFFPLRLERLEVVGPPPSHRQHSCCASSWRCCGSHHEDQSKSTEMSSPWETEICVFHKYYKCGWKGERPVICDASLCTWCRKDQTKSLNLKILFEKATFIFYQRAVLQAEFHERQLRALSTVISCVLHSQSLSCLAQEVPVCVTVFKI